MILFRYVLRDYLRYVGGTVVLCVFLFILFDFIHKSTRYFAINKASTAHILQYYLAATPTQIAQALPIASLLASVITMVLLSRSNEVTAMRAAGMGPWRIASPIALGGGLICLTCVFVGEVLTPLTSARLRYVEKVLIENNSPDSLHQGARWMRRDNSVVFYDDFVAEKQRIRNVKIIELGNNFRPSVTIEAEFAAYLEASDSWDLQNVTLNYFSPTGILTKQEHLETRVEKLPLLPKKMKGDQRKPAEMNISELLDSIRRGKQSGLNISDLDVELHMKIAFYFAAFVVSLIGLPFAYRSERSAEAAKGVLVAISVGLSYWFFLNAGRAMAKRGIIPAPIGAWLANVVIFSYGTWDIIKLRRKS